MLETLTTAHPTTTQHARKAGQLVPEPLGIALAKVPRRQFRECLWEFAPPNSRHAGSGLLLHRPDEPAGFAVAARSAAGWRAEENRLLELAAVRVVPRANQAG